MKRFYLPLFWKFNIGIIAIVIVFGAISILFIWRHVIDALQSESSRRAIYIAKNLADQAIEPLLYEDRLTLQKLVDGVKSIDQSVEYAFILDNASQAIVHTFANGVPRKLIEANQLTSNDEMSALLIYPEREPSKIIRDIAAPILDGKVGVVRVGILENTIHQQADETVKIILSVMNIFILLGIIGAFIFAHVITNPIKMITQKADQLDLDKLTLLSQSRIRIRDRLMGYFPMLFRAEDELDVLAERFNKMIERLEHAYRQLQATQAKLIQSERLASVGTMAAGVAHEINNPLAGLQNCIQRLQKNPERIQQNRKYFELMTEATDKIVRIVTGLLDYTRQQKMSFEPIDIAEVIDKAILLVKFRIEKLRIQLIKNYPKHIPKIMASPGHLQQVFVNILLNSIDAIEEAKQLDPTKDQSIKLSIGREHNKVVIEIEDSGRGIPTAEIGKIFDPFYTTKDVGKGTGLGLSVCYNIITAHGGEIDVTSDVNRGTKVTIRL